MKHISKVIKRRLICGVCGDRAKTQKAANSILACGVCAECVADDHVKGDISDQLKGGENK